MLKFTLLLSKIFALLTAIFVSMQLISYALMLVDESSDFAVVGGIAIIFIVLLADAVIIRALFSNSKPKEENKSAQ